MTYLPSLTTMTAFNNYNLHAFFISSLYLLYCKALALMTVDQNYKLHDIALATLAACYAKYQRNERIMVCCRICTTHEDADATDINAMKPAVFESLYVAFCPLIDVPLYRYTRQR